MGDATAKMGRIQTSRSEGYGSELVRSHLKRPGNTNKHALVERKAALGRAPAFLYLLTWQAPYMGGRYGSVHGTDVPLIFHNPELWPLTAGSPENRRVADRMSDAFIAFAKWKAGHRTAVAAYEPAQNPR